MNSPELRFLFDLAHEKKMLPRELMKRITSRDITELIAYYHIKTVEQELEAADAKNKQTIRG
jgi:hypothetical protein